MTTDPPATTNVKAILADHPLSTCLPPSLLAGLLDAARPKARSIQTHDNIHIPDLNDLSGPVSCLLLGDSMLERFKTTGRETPFGPEPNVVRRVTSTSSLPVTHADDGVEIASGQVTNTTPSISTSPSTFTDPSLIPSHNSHTGVFNAGVGGDNLRNIIYRLVGTPAYPGGLLHVLISLPATHQPRYIFLLAGTNDLGDGKKPLSAPSLRHYDLLIRALTHVFPKTIICVCGLLPKAKVKRTSVVDESNVLLQNLVEQMSLTEGGERAKVEFLPTDELLGLQNLESDGVHLSGEGYAILGACMWARLEAMKVEDSRPIYH